MHDRFGRPLTGLRVSVTNDCNLNCFYCHQEGCVSGDRQMTVEEIGKAIELAAEFGTRKVKLTGGEPLLRRDIADIVAKVSKQPIEEVSMATNGTMLADTAFDLADSGLDRVNISLDTLDPDTYAFITTKPMLEDALAGIDAALDAGLKPVKLNMVLLAGINDDEVERMLGYAASRGAILQLIELLQAPTNEGSFAIYHCDLVNFERKFGEMARAVETRQTMHGRKRYILSEGEVEVVRPMHNSEFCMHCTRLRLTPDGYLKPCLLRSDNLVDLLSHLRAGEMDRARAAFDEAIARREPFFRG